MKRSGKIKGLGLLSLVLLCLLLTQWGTSTSAETIGEGPARTGSDAYRNAGANGNGIIIAVIDNGFFKLTLSQGSNDAPPWASIVDTAVFSSGGLTDSGVVHGTKVVENIYDHAPGARYCLYKVASGIADASQLQEAVDAAIAAGANIISMSIGYRNQGWEDGTGGACAAVKTAADSGILVFVASGNGAVQHWRGPFYDPGDDQLHNWSGADEYNDLTLNGNAEVHATLQWDTSTGITNYDLYLYNNAEDSILDSSRESGETYEDIWYEDMTGVIRTVKLLVRKISGEGTQIQLYATGQTGMSTPIEYFTQAGSIGSPANSNETNVISVGAVTQSRFDTLEHTSGIIEIYSGQGRTNSDRIEPDLVAPTDCNTSLGGLGGTSGATPNAAGTAAAFWSSVPNYSATGVGHLLLEMAEIFKDWGVPGKDTVYGCGGIRLHSYHANTVWIDRDAGNTDGSDTIPYYYVSHAQDSATVGGRIVFISGNYHEPIILNKELLYESIGGSAVLGKQTKILDQQDDKNSEKDAGAKP